MVKPDQEGVQAAGFRAHRQGAAVMEKHWDEPDGRQDEEP